MVMLRYGESYDPEQAVSRSGQDFEVSACYIVQCLVYNCAENVASERDHLRLGSEVAQWAHAANF